MAVGVAVVKHPTIRKPKEWATCYNFSGVWHNEKPGLVKNMEDSQSWSKQMVCLNDQQ